MMTEEQQRVADWCAEELARYENHNPATDLDQILIKTMRIAPSALTQPVSQALKLPEVPPNALVALCEQMYDHRSTGVTVAHDVWQDCIEELLMDVPHTSPIETICATGDAEWVKPVPRELKQVLLELRTYNPKADEHGGKHIIPGWADRIEKALGIKPVAAEEE